MAEYFDYSCSYFIDEQLVVVRYFGRVKLDDVIKVLENVICHPEYNKLFSFLIDVRYCEFSNNADNVKRFFFYIQKKFPFLLGSKTAFLSNTPRQVVIATVLKLLLGKRGNNIHVCSTPEYALNWLELKDHQDLQDLLKTKAKEEK